MAEKFDRFRKPSERPCQCGRGCGLTFTLRPGTGRTRKYAPGCPHVEEIHRETALRYYHKQKTKSAAEKQPRRVRPKAADSHHSVKWCKDCGGLPHRRPPEGCKGCGGAHAADTYKTKGGQTIVVAP